MEPLCHAVASVVAVKAAELTSQEMGPAVCERWDPWPRNLSWAFARLSIYNEELVACLLRA